MSLRQLAYHEAGHAVGWAILMPDVLLSATIQPAETVLSQVILNRDLFEAKQKSDFTAVTGHRILCTLAGPAAEHLYVGTASLPFDYDSDDFKTPLKWAEELYASHAAGHDPRAQPTDFSLYWSDWLVQCLEFVDAHWRSIEIVANALMKQQTLSRSEIVTLVSAGVTGNG